MGLLTAKQYKQRADVIFVGVALEGPTSTGIQRFSVERYLKGSGPETAAIATGVVARSDGTGSTTSVSVDVNAGERWQIYAGKRLASDVLETNQCAGSRKLGFAVAPAPGVVPIPDSPAATVGGGGDRTKTVLLTAGLAAFVVFSLALAVRHRLRRTVSSAG